MFIYTPLQWILIFLIYSLIGWCFESTYVTIKTIKISNRGFLYGPCLPIYGFGAISILFATLPFRTNVFLIFLLGMLSSTLLEYLTGMIMEAIFQVKYWDYSYKKLQIHGYICLSSSIAWGVMSVLLVKFLHSPIEKVVTSLPQLLLEILVPILLMIFSFDIGISSKSALDIKKSISQILKEHEEIARIAKRLEVRQAFTADSIENNLETLHEGFEEIKLKYEIAKSNYEEKLSNLKKRHSRLKAIRFPSINLLNYLKDIDNNEKKNDQV